MVCSFILGGSGRDSGMAPVGRAARIFSDTENLHFSRIQVLSFVSLVIGNETRVVCKIWAGFVLITKSYDQMKFSLVLLKVL